MGAAQQIRRRAEPMPDHQYADKHHLLVAAREYGSRRRLRKVEDLQPSGEVACSRVREYAFDLGAELDMKHGWLTKAAERMGIHRNTLWNITHEVVRSISTETVDQIARASGIPIGIFYDPEV